MRNHLVPIVPTIERLGRSRLQSNRAVGERGGGEGRGGTKSPPALEGPRPRPRTTAPTSRHRDNRSVAAVDSPFPYPPRRGVSHIDRTEKEVRGAGLNQNSNFYRRPEQKKGRRNRTGARTAELPLVAVDSSRRLGAGSDSKRNVVATGGSDETWPGLLGQIVPSGVEAIAGLPLSGDERDEFATKAMTIAAALSRSQAGTVEKNNRGRRRPSLHQLPSARDHGDLEREAVPGATTAAVPSTPVREGAKNMANAYSALAPALSPAPFAAGEGGVRSTAQQQETLPCSQQWGGFGPGYTPKYYRGRFGVAGERKRIIRRQSEDADAVEDIR